MTITQFRYFAKFLKEDKLQQIICQNNARDFQSLTPNEYSKLLFSEVLFWSIFLVGVFFRPPL